MTITTAIANELARIGSTYHRHGWQHRDTTRGPLLVQQLCAANQASASQTPIRPAAHGRRGEPGTVICASCGKRGQDVGTVCDHCGQPVR